MFDIFKKKPKEGILCSPVDGDYIALEEVKDKMFAEKMLGDGVAFIFKGSMLYAPCNGSISMIAVTKHALGIKSDDGMEVLLHIGLDTVNLGGSGFNVLVKQGDKVKVGTPIIEIDRALMDAKEIDLTTPLIITNSNNYNLVKENVKTVKVGDLVLTSVKK